MRNCILFLILFLAISDASALAIHGESLKEYIMFEPGLERTYTYKFVNNDGSVGDYGKNIKKIQGGNLFEYFEVTPQQFTDVMPGEAREFTITIKLPDSLPDAGENIYAVGIEQTASEGGMISARAAVGIKYTIFVLFPYRYIEWDLMTRNLNVDQKSDITVNLRNLGVPDVSSITGHVEIIGPDETVMKTLEIQRFSLASKAEKSISVTFDSTGMPAGAYTAVATIDWDGNTSVKESGFRIGEKNVFIHNFTDTFFPGAINKLLVDVESGWNTPIDNTYADIEVFDDGQRISSFRSLPTRLSPWERKDIEGYFDTTGLNKTSYRMKVILRYDGSETISEKQITMTEESKAELMTEMPGFIANTTFIVILGFAVLIALVGVFALLHMNKKEHHEDVDKMMSKLSEKYTKKELEQMLKERGWSEEQIRKVLRK